MNPHLMIWPVIRRSGERVPVIKERATGVPLFMPVVYTIEMLNGQASTSVEKTLQSILFLYTWADVQYRKWFKGELTLQQQEEARFSLEKRFENGLFLTKDEITNLCHVLGQSYEVYCHDNFSETPRKVIPIDKREGVSKKTKRIHIRYVIKFLDWLSDYWLGKIEDAGKHTPAEINTLHQKRKKMLERLNDRKGKVPGGGRVYERREGLPLETQLRLKQIIDPASEENPWKSETVRIRNQLFVEMLLDLGLRRGELLGVRTTDIFGRKITIEKRTIDKHDRRRRKPYTKSRGRRTILLNDHLERLFKSYVLGARKNVRGKISQINHTYLFVATDTGREMSSTTAQEIFEAIEKHHDMPEFSPHIMRHTWNDNFSRHCDKHKISKEDEIKWRMAWMGWRDRKMAEVYTVRSTEEQANAAIAKMHAEMFAGIEFASLQLNP